MYLYRIPLGGAVLSARSNGLLSLSKCQVIVNGNEAVLKTVVEKSASGFESQAWRLME